MTPDSPAAMSSQITRDSSRPKYTYSLRRRDPFEAWQAHVRAALDEASRVLATAALPGDRTLLQHVRAELEALATAH